MAQVAKAADAAPVVRLGIAELERRIQRDRSTVWRWCRAGSFPAPHYIGGRRAWFLHDVEAWEVAEMARPAPDRPGPVVVSGGERA